jgi:hypothetical protein
MKKMRRDRKAGVRLAEYTGIVGIGKTTAIKNSQRILEERGVRTGYVSNKINTPAGQLVHQATKLAKLPVDNDFATATYMAILFAMQQRIVELSQFVEVIFVEHFHYFQKAKFLHLAGMSDELFQWVESKLDEPDAVIHLVASPKFVQDYSATRLAHDEDVLARFQVGLIDVSWDTETPWFDVKREGKSRVEVAEACLEVLDPFLREIKPLRFY